MPERWLPIAGYEGIYDVSDLGRVRRLKRRLYKYESTLREPALMSQGYQGPARKYLGVVLSTRGKKVPRCVHRLVLAAFVGPAPAGMEAAHLDGDPSNNRVTNLRWVTRKENAEHRRQHGTMPIGSRHANSKLTEDDVRAIRRVARRGNHMRLANQYGVCRSLISQIARGEIWTHVC